MSDEISVAIKRDRAEHPECNYSQSSSTQCSMQNNELVCDTVRRVMRMCQGQRPVEIFRKTETSTDDSSQQMPSFPHFPQLPDFSSSHHGDMFGDPFKMMDKFMSGFFGGGFSSFFGDEDFHFSQPSRNIDRYAPHNHDDAFQHNRHENLLPPHIFPKGQYPKAPQKAAPLTGMIIGKEESV